MHLLFLHKLSNKTNIQKLCLGFSTKNYSYIHFCELPLIVLYIIRFKFKLHAGSYLLPQFKFKFIPTNSETELVAILPNSVCFDVDCATLKIFNLRFFV